MFATPRSTPTAMLLLLRILWSFVAICWMIPSSPKMMTTNAWILPTQSGRTTTTTTGHPWRTSTQLQQQPQQASTNPPRPEDVLDVEFEPVQKVQKPPKTKRVPPPTTTTTTSTPKTLLDLSLEAGNAEWKEARIPFCRTSTDNPNDVEYIDSQLAFTVDLEGQTYGIGVPFDDAVAIVVETFEPIQDGNQKEVQSTVTYINPDDYFVNDDAQELMEIMAKQVNEQLGEEYTLRKTPKVLTIAGGLSELTDNWERNLLPDPASVEDLLQESTGDNDSDPETELEEFYKIMKQQIGEKEFEKTMQEDEMSEEDLQLMEMFEPIPGRGGQGDEKEMAELFQSILDDVKQIEEDESIDEEEGVLPDSKQFQLNTDGMSLKLIGYQFGDGSKTYSLVKLLQPYVLVGRYDGTPLGMDGEDDNDDDKDDDDQPTPRPEIRFELLSKEEERLLIPRLEQVAKQDLEAAGLSLASTDEEQA